jgi:hypothetical protein
MTYTVPDVVIVSEFFDGGGPVAQSFIDSGGQSVAFASLPYPGENAITFPGLFALITGQSLPAGYPFYAQAVYPQVPSAEVKDPSGSYRLTAAADQDQATGDARLAFGADQPVSQTTSATEAVLGSDGKLTVSAQSVAQGLSVGEGALQIGSLLSRSVSTYTPGEAEPTTTTELVVEGAKVGETPVMIGPDGVRAGGGGAAPVPIGQGSDQLNEALAQSGLSVRTVAAHPVKGGSAGDVLEIRIKHPVPSPEGGQVEGTLIMRFGGTTTAITVGGAAPTLPPEEETIGPENNPESEPSGSDLSNADGVGFSNSDSVAVTPGATPAFFEGPMASEFGSIDQATAFAPGAGGLGDDGYEAGFGESVSPAPASDQAGVTAALPRPAVAGQAALVTSQRARSSVRWLFALIAMGAVAMVTSSAVWRRRGVGSA